MTTAEQLLASLSEVDKTFIIDNDLRTIKIPASVANLGVESDDDVLTVQFQMPGTYCGIDLSKFNIRINYLNAAGEGDYHDVDDAVVQSDGTIRFSWTIGRHAASVVGNVEFNICLKKTDSSGKVLKEFNTTTASLPILKGLEVSEQVIQQYHDILEQWRAKLFGIGDTEEARLLAVSQEQQRVISTKSVEALSDIELKGSETLATIPDTYTEVYNMADEAIRTKADAIVCDADGETIFVNGSSDNHIRGLNVHGKTTQISTTGKNLCSLGTVEFDALVRTKNDIVLTPGTYTFSAVITSSDTDDVINLVRIYTDDETSLTDIGMRRSANGTRVSSTFTIDTERNRIYLYAGSNYNGSTGDTAIFKNIQIEAGTVATDYEPYTGGVPGPNPNHPLDLVSVGDGHDINIYFNGNNLFDPYNGNNVSASTTVGEDGWVTVDIPANSNIQFSNLFTPSSDRIVVGREYAIKCEVKEIENGSLHYMSVHTEVGGSSQFHKTYSANTVGTFKTLATAVYSQSEAMYMLRGYFGIADLTKTARCVYRIWVYPAELGDVEYEPYVESQTITLNRTLPGIPVTSDGNYTDENGQQWICDEIDFERGVYVQRIRTIEINGSENWRKNVENASNNYLYWLTISDVLKEKTGKYMCNKLGWKPIDALAIDGNTIDQTGVSDKNTNNVLYINVGHYMSDNTVDGLKTWLSTHPMSLCYIMGIPIETPLTSEEILAYKALKTNYPNTTVVNDSDAHMSLAYSADTLLFLRDHQKPPTDEQVSDAVNAYLNEHGVQIPSDEYITNLMNGVITDAIGGSY